jgi:hypothetical protein
LEDVLPEDDETPASKFKRRKYADKGTYIEDLKARDSHFSKKKAALVKKLGEIGAETGAYAFLYIRPYIVTICYADTQPRV